MTLLIFRWGKGAKRVISILNLSVIRRCMMRIEQLFRLARIIPISIIAIVIAILVIALSGCNQKKRPNAPQIQEVGVVTIQPQMLPVTTELLGRTSAYLVAEVRARVDGIVLSRDFNEGSYVSAGQHLYKIDPAWYQAQLDNAKAALAKAQANLAAATAQLARDKALIAAHAISQQDYDNGIAAHRQAIAEIAASKALVKNAKINLSYTDVVSPIAGRIGKSQVTKGAYVQASQATLLATIQQIDPIFVDVRQSSADWLRLRREISSPPSSEKIKVNLMLEDGTRYPLQGQFQFSDITVDPNTGAITLRALFPNPKQELLPGMFVRAKIYQGTYRMLTVPQIGVMRDAKGQPMALTVDSNHQVVQRTFVTSRTFGDRWVVTGGLNPGDSVIVQGVQKVRPGMTVKPVAVTFK